VFVSGEGRAVTVDLVSLVEHLAVRGDRAGDLVQAVRLAAGREASDMLRTENTALRRLLDQEAEVVEVRSLDLALLTEAAQAEGAAWILMNRTRALKLRAEVMARGGGVVGSTEGAHRGLFLKLKAATVIGTMRGFDVFPARTAYLLPAESLEVWRATRADRLAVSVRCIKPVIELRIKR